MHPARWIVLSALLILVSLACGAPFAPAPPTASPPPAATQELSPTPPLSPTLTPLPPSPTLDAPALTFTPLPPSLTPSTVPDTLTPLPKTMRVKIFLIALSDDGASGLPVGCGDSAVPVEVEVPYTQGVLRAALSRLLEIDGPYYGQSGLYNALYQSELSAGEIAIQDGLAVIQLEGSLLIGGMCDAPRVQAQIEQTALQFSTVQQVAVFVNGVPLHELLSTK